MHPEDAFHQSRSPPAPRSSNLVRHLRHLTPPAAPTAPGSVPETPADASGPSTSSSSCHLTSMPKRHAPLEEPAATSRRPSRPHAPKPARPRKRPPTPYARIRHAHKFGEPHAADNLVHPDLAIIKFTYKAPSKPRQSGSGTSPGRANPLEVANPNRSSVRLWKRAWPPCRPGEPHFLFNTLASIDHLIETDPPRASIMQKNLIALLRASMPTMPVGSQRPRHPRPGRELAVIPPTWKS